MEILARFTCNEIGFVRHGVPFGKNILLNADIKKLRLINEKNEIINSQWRTTIKWPETNYVQFALLSFKCDTPGIYTVQLDENDLPEETKETEKHLQAVAGLVNSGGLTSYVEDKNGVRYIPKSLKYNTVEIGDKSIIRYDWEFKDNNDKEFLWATMYSTMWKDIPESIELDIFLKNSYNLENPIGWPALKTWSLIIDAPKLECRWTNETQRKISKTNINGKEMWHLELLANTFIEDMQHNGARVWIADNEDKIAEMKKFIPLIFDREYLNATGAIADFGHISRDRTEDYNIQENSRVHHTAWHFGQPYGSTHTTGSPYITAEYSLPYWMTGQKYIWEHLDKFSWYGMTVRPFHVFAYNGRYDIDDQDLLNEGQYHSSKWYAPGTKSRQNAVENTHRDLQAKNNENEPPSLGNVARHGINGWDIEHLQLDDLLMRYQIDGHPKALESIQELLETVLTIQEHKYNFDAPNSARMFGLGLKALVQGYQLTSDERYWHAATILLNNQLHYAGWKRVEGAPDVGRGEGYAPLLLPDGGTNKKNEAIISIGGWPPVSEFKPFMSATGIWGIALYVLAELQRRQNGNPDSVPLERLRKIIIDTANAVVWADTGEGIYYLVDVTRDRWAPEDGTYASYDGTGWWSAITLAVAILVAPNLKDRYLPTLHKLLARKYERHGAKLFCDRMAQLALWVDSIFGGGNFEEPSKFNNTPLDKEGYNA